MFHGVAEFGARGVWVAFGGHLLKQAVLVKVVNESSFLQTQMTAYGGEIFAHRGVSNKLLHERFSIWPGFGEEQNTGGMAIDAMDDKGPLPLGFQFLRKEK